MVDVHLSLPSAAAVLTPDYGGYCPPDLGPRKSRDMLSQVEGNQVTSREPTTD